MIAVKHAAKHNAQTFAVIQSIRQRASKTLVALGIALIVAAIAAAGVGAVPMSWGQVLELCAQQCGLDLGLWHVEPAQRAALFLIRLPRLLFASLLGASLAISGAAIQGIMRNPLADPGLIGTSSGGALGAALMIVVGWRWWPDLMSSVGLWALPLGAGVGALLVTWLTFRLASRANQVDISILLLTGVAMNALLGAGLGLLIYWADEAQLRDLTSWSLGSLSRATWSSLQIAGPIMALATAGLWRESARLNAALLGDGEARSLGVDIEQLKMRVIFLASAAVGAGVSFVGVVGFIGLVVPHVLRLWMGSDHRPLLTGAALLGAALLLFADMAARTWDAPAELPLGVVTALIGAPFFLHLLMRRARALEGR